MKPSTGFRWGVCLLALGHALAACPATAELKKWSETVTATAGGNVVINDQVLLDESPPDLYNLTVNAGGRLVFDPSMPLNLRVANIFVYGELIIGSETCPYSGELTITLTGTRALHAGETNPKAIMVFPGGALEVHGKPKRSWTKLAATLEAVKSESDGILFDHLGDDSWEKDRDRRIPGIAAYIFSKASGSWEPRRFGIVNTGVKRQLAKLVSAINSVNDGEVLMMASQKFIRPFADLSVCDALETLIFGEVTGTLKLRDVPDDGTTWALIYEKGNLQSLSEESNRMGTPTIASYMTGEKILFEAGSGNFLDRNPTKYNNVDQFRVSTKDGDFQLVEVIDDVTTWMPGDKVVIASTDYDFGQTEERTIVECNECTNKQFRIDSPVEFTHFGKVLYGAVDVRGEVGVLTRNVVIQGEMEAKCPSGNGNCGIEFVENLDTFGAHVKALKGFDRVKIEFAEFRNVGQQTDAGRYPIHFHMCEETSGDDYVWGNSIHNSFARCVTIHGTHNVLVGDNFCYKHMGHGYFLEDGGEQNNTLDGNLGLLTIRGTGRLEPLDCEFPSTFWITSPLNTVINNVGAAGEGNGFWFIFPEQSLSPSDGFLGLDVAKSSLMNDVYNNVGHSNKLDGVRVGERLLTDRNFVGGTRWQPREDPTDINSAPIWGSLSYLTGYKNLRNNIWVEGGRIHLHHISSADGFAGATLTSAGTFLKFSGKMSDAVFVGDSENIGKPIEGLGRSVPRRGVMKQPHCGLQMWKGPIQYDNLWFADFEPNGVYDNPAIAKRRNSPYQNPFPSNFRNVQTSFTDKPGGAALTMSGDATNNWVNRDGELVAGFVYWPTPDTKYYVVKDDHLSAAASDCVVRPNWRMALCTTKYGNLRMIGEFDEGATFVLHSRPSAKLTFAMDAAQGPNVVLDGSEIYTAHFNEMPETIRLRGLGLQKGDVLTVGVCLPPRATFELASIYAFTRICRNCWKSVASLEALQQENTGKAYFFEENTGMFYYKMVGFLDREPDEDQPCANGNCPDLRITVLSGDLSNTDCRNRIYTSEQLNAALDPLPEDTSEIPPTGNGLPPAGIGAGLTKPFMDRESVDGGFGQWSEWSDCSCVAGEQTRRRACDSPMPDGDGADCAGNWLETRACACSITN